MPLALAGACKERIARGGKKRKMEEKVTMEFDKEELSILKMGVYLFSEFIDEKIREYQGTLLEPYARGQKSIAEKLGAALEEKREKLREK